MWYTKTNLGRRCHHHLSRSLHCRALRRRRRRIRRGGSGPRTAAARSKGKGARIGRRERSIGGDDVYDDDGFARAVVRSMEGSTPAMVRAEVVDDHRLGMTRRGQL